MAATSVLHTSHLKKYYGSLRAVEDVSLDIQRGEIFGFLGPNGAGKTTTINMLLGLTYVTSGTITIFGEEVTPRHNAVLRRVGTMVGSMESDKVFRRRLLWIGLIIAILPMVIAFIAFFNVDKSPSFSRYWVWPGGLISALAFADGYSPGYGYAAYLLAVVVGLVTAQEYSWRTMQLWLSHGIPRPLLLLAKFVIALILVLLITLAFLLIGGLISIILTYQLHGSTGGNVFDGTQLFLSYLRTCYGLLPYVALTFLLVVVSRSAAVAISGLVLFMLAIELPLTALLPLLGKNYAQAAQFLPAGLANAMNQQNYTSAHLTMPVLLSANHMNSATAAICIALYTLVLFGISFWIFQRQNLSN